MSTRQVHEQAASGLLLYRKAEGKVHGSLLEASPGKLARAGLGSLGGCARDGLSRLPVEEDAFSQPSRSAHDGLLSLPVNEKGPQQVLGTFCSQGSP